MSISRSTLLAAVAAASLLTTTARADDLAASVAGRLRDSGVLAGYRVNVKAKSGTVWLEGSVADDKQLATAVGIAESSPGVERVVNRLVIDAGGRSGGATALGMPASSRSIAGVAAATPTARRAAPAGADQRAGAGSSQPDVRLVQATTPSSSARAKPAAPGRLPLPLSAVTAQPPTSGWNAVAAPSTTQAAIGRPRAKQPAPAATRAQAKTFASHPPITHSPAAVVWRTASENSAAATRRQPRDASTADAA